MIKYRIPKGAKTMRRKIIPAPRTDGTKLDSAAIDFGDLEEVQTDREVILTQEEDGADQYILHFQFGR